MQPLVIRKLVASDMNKIIGIHDGSFSLPSPEDLLCVDKRVVVSGGGIIAAGFCRITSEGILVLDHNTPRSLRVRALASLVRELSGFVRSSGIDECHVFADAPDTCSILEHLGFEHCSGLPMVRSL